MRRKLSLENRILLVLAAGFVAGTFFVNFYGQQYVGELGIFSDSYREYLIDGNKNRQYLFVYLLIQRLIPTMILIGVIGTGWRMQILGVLGVWATFSLGVYWSACILVCGMEGMIIFMLSLIPHGLFYGWSWIRLGRHVIDRTVGMRWLPGILLALLLGIAAETYIHPELMGLIMNYSLKGIS